jgi:HEAT repeat protein
MARDPQAGVGREALLALGRIATDEAGQFFREALASEAEALRTEAAAACLLAAERQLAEGHTETAMALYDAVRQAPVPLPCRAGALRGAIVARGAAGVPLLLEHLRSPEPGLCDAALLAVRERPSEALADALNAEVDRAPVELQPRLLLALADCHNAQSLAVLRRLAASEDAEVRRTALTVLGALGGAPEADVLLEAVRVNRSPEECAVALGSLRRLAGAGVDEQITQALGAATDSGTRVHLIRLLEARGARSACDDLLAHAAGPEAPVAVAALRALKSLAGTQELPALIALVKASREDSVRDAAESAVVGVCTRADAREPGTRVVLAELQQAAAPAAKCSWVRILAALGRAEALPTLRSALNDTDETVANQALEQLGRWPDPEPTEDLLGIAETAADPVRRRRALASVIQLATVAADKRQRPEAVIVGWLERAGKTASSAPERLLIVSVLGRLKDLASLRLLTPHLEAPEVRNEAALAIVQIAPALRQADPVAIRSALERAAAAATDAGVRGQAEKLVRGLARQGVPAVLFDGQSLAGWEGDTTIWRVRDGALVGGSLEGNPRNDFLATTARYDNFVLRFEFRLVGTEGFVNGGVQFRSTRLAPPSHEVCGYQADIGAGYTGFLYDESRRNQVLARPAEEMVRRLETADDWKRYEVRCLGPRIQLLVNGEKTVDYTEPDPAIPQEGMVALQIHGGCKAEISFRNLTLGEVPYDLATHEFCIPRERWKVLSCSSENTEGEDERAVLAIDGDPRTFWHSQWHGAQPPHPHHLAVDLGEEVAVIGFTYLPRQDGRQEKGVIGAYEFYASRDGTDWGQPVATGRLEDTDTDPAGRVVIWARPVTARCVRLVALDAPGGHPFAGAAELGVVGWIPPP